jgi:putative ABC transport system permease protein
MIQHYLKIAVRNLWKYKAYSIINILGLTIGMACVIIIMRYVQTELSYDNFHGKQEQIYRLNIEVTNPQTGEHNARAIGPYRLKKELEPDFPDFTEITRIVPAGRELIEFNDQRFSEEGLAFVDPNIFEVFHFPLIKGDPANVLEDPFSLVVTQEIGEKYFGKDDPVGKTITIRDRAFKISGIIAAIPDNSQFQFNMLVSMNCAEQVFSRIVLENWGEGSAETFVLIPADNKPADYEARLVDFVAVKLEAWAQAKPRIQMQPLTQIYLHSQDVSSFSTGGDIAYVYAFSFIAFFILVIACINFMNLATARSSLRAKEVGMRKVVGASRMQLVGQFLGESTILALLSLLLAVGLAYLVLPFFNSLTGMEMTMSVFDNWPVLLGLLGITAFVGLAAGSYPALLLSAFKPISVLSGTLQGGAKSGILRKVLVVFQFSISIFLLVVTGIVYRQLDYCKNINLGFDKDQLVVVEGTPTEMRGQYAQFQAELLNNPKIINAGASSRVPPGRLSSSIGTRPEGIPEDQRQGMQTVWTDFDMIETMGYEMAAGRSFSRDFPSDAKSAFILNEAAVKSLGWTNESAINKGFGSAEIDDWESGQWVDRDGKVIGVLKDFHFESLKREIVPTVYFIAPYMAWNYVIRLKTDNIPQTIDFIKNKWEQFNAEAPFEYTFVDENFAELYKTEERQAKVFFTFALFAILIACLGLIGLTSFTAEQKKREVGIRKILGASSFHIVYMLTKEFTGLVIIAFLIAVPFAWYLMQSWLEDFAYQVTVGVSIFLTAGLLSLLIAWLTVGLQTAQAALANPMDSLRQD